MSKKVQTLQKRINSVMNEKDYSAITNEWQRSFMESINRQLGNGKKDLSEKQTKLFDKIEALFTPEKKKEQAAWAKKYKDTLRDDALMVAKYYKSQNMYFRDLASSILGDENFVPSKKQYEKMCCNSYAKMVKENWKQSPKYEAGSIFFGSKSGWAKYSATARKFVEGKMVLVLEVDHEPPNAVVGGKKYLVMPCEGSMQSYTVEERNLRQLPKELK